MINHAILPEPIIQLAANLVIDEVCRELCLSPLTPVERDRVLSITYLRLLERSR